MKKSILTLVVIALSALAFVACDNVAPATEEAPKADTAAVVTVDSAAAVNTNTVVAKDTVKK